MAEMTTSTPWKESIQGFMRNGYSACYHPEMPKNHGYKQSSAGPGHRCTTAVSRRRRKRPTGNEAITHSHLAHNIP